MKVLDLFCGCGGLSLGFEQAGYEILGGIDLNPHRQGRSNIIFPRVSPFKPIFEVLSIEAIEERIPNLAEVEVLIGGPPCQGFSSANRWTHESEDVRNRLFFEFVELADTFNPRPFSSRTFVASSRGTTDMQGIESTKFSKNVVTMSATALNASHYGVPQNSFATSL